MHLKSLYTKLESLLTSCAADNGQNDTAKAIQEGESSTQCPVVGAELTRRGVLQRSTELDQGPTQHHLATAMTSPGRSQQKLPSSKRTLMILATIPSLLRT